MRLLLDEDFSPRMAKVLARGGHDAVSVHEAGLSGATDAEVFRFAMAEKRCLVTLEASFGQMHLFPAAPMPAVSTVAPCEYTEKSIEEVLVTCFFKLRHLARRRKWRD